MVKAIDMHSHFFTGPDAGKRVSEYKELAAYFGAKDMKFSADEIAEYYRSMDMKVVMFDIDMETQTGLRMSNDDIAAAVRKHPDVLIGFGSVDPWKGKVAVAEVERCVKELGLKGLKFQQAEQAFFPDDRRFYPIYEKAAELGIPVLFHMGTTGVGAGTPGGKGIKLKYCKPIPHIDDVAADFPELTIIGAHPAWPWTDEMLAVLRHKANVYMDLSGWAPKYFPEALVKQAGSILQDKMLFGTDFPSFTPERWLNEFDQLNFKPHVKQKILLENAMKVLKL